MFAFGVLPRSLSVVAIVRYWPSSKVAFADCAHSYKQCASTVRSPASMFPTWNHGQSTDSRLIDRQIYSRALFFGEV
jgi:hypothetical protein